MPPPAGAWAGAADARRYFALLAANAGAVVELRAIGVQGIWGSGIVSGYFDDQDKFVQAAAELDGRAEGVYATINPVRAELLARANNRLVERPKHSTSDGEITRRRHLLIDVDPVRPAGISASDDERAAAFALIKEVVAHLASLGFQAPVAADSGNGAHTLYRIDLPADDGGLVQRVLEALAFRFDTGAAKVDTTVANPARISKLYGTLAGKGDEIAGRPHRRSEILLVPDPLVVVARELLESVAAQAPKASTTGAPASSAGFDVEAFFARNGIGIARSGSWRDGRRWILEVCPFNAEHGDRSAYVVQFGSGALGAGCHHNSCSAKGWHDLRELFEPAAGRGRAGGATPTGGLSSVSSLSSPPSFEDETPIEPWPDPPAPVAYAGLAGEFVRTVEQHSEADPAALLASFLLGFGNVVGRAPYVVAEADHHYANEFGVLVGRTSKGRKGTSLGRVKRTLEVADPAWAHDRVLGGLSSGEGVIWQVRDPITKQEPIRVKKRIVGYQQVQVDGGVADKRVFVVESEFASVLNRMQREGNTLSATIREAWDHGHLSSLTKNSPARASGAHVSILAHVTKAEVLRLIAKTDVMNGFMNRFLWFAVRRSKCLAEGGQPDPTALAQLGWRVRDAALFAGGLGEVSRDAAAAALWAKVYPNLSEGLPGLLGAATGRAEAHVLRLALIYALLDKSPVISESHLRSALALWDYCFRSARYVFGAAMADPLAERVRALLDAAGLAGVLKSDLYAGLGGHVEKHLLGAALVALYEAGLADVLREPTGGRPAERWFAGTHAKEARKAREGGAR